MSSFASLSATDSASLSISQRRSSKNTLDDSAPSIVMPESSIFDYQVDSAETSAFMTPTSHWSPATLFETLSQNSHSQSTASEHSLSSRRSSFSDIDDDDYSSDASIEVFQARRETVKRATPQRLRWEAGSLRREYARETNMTNSVDSGHPTVKDMELSAGSFSTAAEGSSSFFHHNSLRRHNSTGNYTRALLSKSLMTPGLGSTGEATPEENQLEVHEVIQGVRSGGAQKVATSKRHHRNHRARIIVSSRTSSLIAPDEQSFMGHAYEELDVIEPSSLLQRRLARNESLSLSSLSGSSTMPPTPPDSQPPSPQPTEVAFNLKRAAQPDYNSMLEKPNKTYSGNRKSIIKPTFSLTDKLFSGIKLLR